MDTKNNQKKEQQEKEKTIESLFVDESYRMDDNSGLSEIAINENANQDDELIPGIGVEDKE